MAAGAYRPPPEELALGLGFYATRSPPTAGRIKTRPEDFGVREISEYPRPDPDGAYTVLRVRSSDWEQHELAERIARRLGLPPHALSWAGTKDRRAVAERLLSYRGSPPSGPIGLPRVEILEAYRARDGLSLGHHFGNAFEVTVRGIAEPEADVAARFEATRRELAEFGGIPNFFGPQRFGEVRPVTHLVGRALARGDPAGAVETYLTYVPPGAVGEGDEARRRYAADHDPGQALRSFPPSFGFERRLLDHLARGHPPERALRALSGELRKLFVHAYQAFLFNRWLSIRQAAGLPLDRPLVGDHLLRRSPDGTTNSRDPIPVGSDNLPEALELVARGGAVVAGPLVGHATPAPEGPAGEALREVLGEEAISPGDFRLPATPDLASAGAWRAALVPAPPIDLAWLPSDGAAAATDPPGGAVRFHFSLPKGSYATILLREFRKDGATPEPATSNQRF